jgi:hypothetical protein
MSRHHQRRGILRCGRRWEPGFGEMLLRDHVTGRLQPLASIDFGLDSDMGEDERELDLNLLAILDRQRS